MNNVFNKRRTVFTCEPQCSGRKPGCQDHCEKYLTEKAKNDRIRKREAEEHKIDDYTIGTIYRRMNDSAKQKKKGYRRRT